jgi:DNA-binding NtrC family response regulator
MLAPPVDLLRRASPSLEGLLDRACRGAASDAPLLILGESGTGRTALARALHAASARRDKPLVEVDPGSLPSTLFESEFFGHVAGAFTGAESSLDGRVARAEGGSLLLDHIEETPVGAQPKLLRLLAERRFAPLGGQDTEADVRFLAIASEDLPRRVDTGAFRTDLFYRLEVLTLRLPPLRERMGDLPALLGFFLGDLAQRFGRDIPRVSSAAYAWMESYSWPGNLRQLRNLLEREVVLSTSEIIDPAAPEQAGGLPRSLVEIEKAQILRALEHTRGHQGRAAEILGISRKSLWEKRKRYNLP